MTCRTLSQLWSEGFGYSLSDSKPPKDPRKEIKTQKEKKLRRRKLEKGSLTQPTETLCDGRTDCITVTSDTAEGGN